jgi:hypothetical protein
VFNAGGNIAPDPGKIVCSLHRSKTPRYFLLYLAHTEVSFTLVALQTFLIELNTQVKDNGGALDQEQADAVRIEYRALLMEGEIECPPPDEDKEEYLAHREVSFTLVVGIGNAFIGHKSQHFIFVVDQTFK